MVANRQLTDNETLGSCNLPVEKLVVTERVSFDRSFNPFLFAFFAVVSETLNTTVTETTYLKTNTEGD